MSDDAYEEILDRAISRALTTLPQVLTERSTASDRLGQLLRLSPSEREAALARVPPPLAYLLASHALERCERAIARDLRLALELTRLSRSIATRSDPKTCGGAQAVADLRAYAMAMEGNVQRVAGNLAGALAAFERSRELQERGGVDPDLLGRIDLMEASLRRDIGQFAVAFALLGRATETFLALGERRRWLQAQVNRANVLLKKDQFDDAALVLEALGESNDPQETLWIRHNMASALISAGRPYEASKIFEETRKLHLRFSDPLSTNRRLWLEGAIAQGLGQQERAERLLREASDDLAERGYAFDAALARLDLDKLQARQRAEPVC